MNLPKKIDIYNQNMYNFSIAISFEKHRLMSKKNPINLKLQKWREWMED